MAERERERRKQTDEEKERERDGESKGSIRGRAEMAVMASHSRGEEEWERGRVAREREKGGS